MKQTKFRCIYLIFFLVFISNINASINRRYAPFDASDFNLTINNDVQVSDRILEFDISLLNINTSTPFELATVQAGIILNSAIVNGGTLTVTMVTGSSQLVNPPLSIIYDPVTFAIKVTPKSGPGAGSGTILSTTTPGTKVCRLRITNSVAFTANSKANLAFNFTTSPYPTKVAEYISSVNTQLTCDATNCFSNAANSTLNATPTAYSVNGSGSYCQNSGGLPVGLSNSEVGVTYTLYNGTTALSPTVAGTGSAISFGSKLAGTYTVKGTNLGGTIDMNGGAVITETPSLTASVSIASNQNNACSGTSVTFTATPTNGGTSPSYQWYKGTTEIGSNSATYSYVPANGDIIKVVMTSNATPCLIGSPATSNTVTMVVNPNLTAGVSIAAGANNVCPGTSVTFTATPTNGGTTPTYQWYNGTTAVGTNSATYTYTPTNGDVIKVVMTSNATPCLVGSPVTSNTVTMVVNPTLTAAVSIVSDQNNVCSGTSVTFTATPANGGSSPTYQWYKGTTVVGSNSATYSYVPANGDIVKVVMTSTATPCLIGSPATSNTVSMSVTPSLTASVSIASDQNSICTGTSVTFTATPTNGGTSPTYQWYNGTTAIGTNSPTYSYAPANGDIIKVIMTSNATPCLIGSPATSNTVTMVVNPTLTAAVSIAAGANNVCSGTSVTFTVTPTNGGTTPTYQWYNGTTAVGTNSATYTYTPTNGDVIKVVMNSNATPCLVGSPVTSNTVTMVVNPTLTAAVSIVSDQNNVCSGTSVTFTATPANGGSSPTYQWYKGTTAVGSNSATYSYVPANGDIIKVIMTSNATSCLIASPATSNSITMIVNPTISSDVSIQVDVNPVITGHDVVFTATPVGGGTSPYYQWFVNNNQVGVNLPTYTYNPVDKDRVYVLMNSNASPCLVGSPATSNIITMSVIISAVDNIKQVSIYIYSQNKNIFINCSEKANKILVYNTLGSLVFETNNVEGMKRIDMNNDPVACYFVKVVTDNQVYSGKILLK